MVSECECPGQRLLASECDLSLLMKITPGQHLNTGVVMSLALARPCLHCVTSYNQGEECHASHSDHRSDLLIPGQISDLCSCINIVRSQISVPVLTLLRSSQDPLQATNKVSSLISSVA